MACTADCNILAILYMYFCHHIYEELTRKGPYKWIFFVGSHFVS